MKKIKQIIIQDDREPELQLLADLNKTNLEFYRKRLLIGDYILEDCIIERKTIDDFCSSILDKRIENQIEGMLTTNFKQKIIIVIGNIKDRKVNIHENCVLGKEVSLVLKYGIKLLFCEDEFQFLYLLKNIADKNKVIKNEM